MSAEKRTSAQAKSFWPKVYRPNLSKKHSDVVKAYGGAEKVMGAEKKWIWDALGYENQCKVLPASKCSDAVENRHRSSKRASEYYHHKAAYKTCKYTKETSSCRALDKVDKKLSLQFLRWLLHELDPQRFREYVLKFPHQVDEEHYGYNLEEQHQYIPVNVVQELQDEVRKQSSSPTTQKPRTKDCEQVKMACAKAWRKQSLLLSACDKTNDECKRHNMALMQQSAVLTKRLKVLQDKLQDATTREPSRKISSAAIDKCEREMQQLTQERNALSKEIKRLGSDLEICTNNSRLADEELPRLRREFKQLGMEKDRMDKELKNAQAIMAEAQNYTVQIHERHAQYQAMSERQLMAVREQIAAEYDDLAREIADHYHHHVAGPQISQEEMKPYLQTAALCKKLEAQIADTKIELDDLLSSLVSTRKKIFGFNGLLRT